MALLALAGLKGWAQERGYTYTKVTEFPSNPDPTKEYFLGYENGGTYYLYASGTDINGMTLSLNQAEAKPFTFGTGLMYGFMPVNTAKCDDLYLSIVTSGANQGVCLGSTLYSIGITNGGDINDGSSSRYLYADGQIIKAGITTLNRLSFYERTGSAAPTYTVTVTPDATNCSASADKDEYEEGETVTLSYEADALHDFVEWQSSDVTITGNTFTMPAQNVSVIAHFAAKPNYSITATVAPEGAGTVAVTYNGNPVEEAPEGLTIDLAYTVNPGFTFQNFTITGATLNQDGVSFTMPANEVAVTANFAEMQAHTLTVQQPTEGGTITATTPSGTLNVEIPEGPAYLDDVITLQNTPALNGAYEPTHRLNHYQVVPYVGEPYSVAPDVAQFTMPDCNTMVTGVFDQIYNVYAASYSTGGMAYSFLYGGGYDPVTKFVEGDHVYVRAAAEEGYRVQRVETVPSTLEYWQEGNEYHFYMPASDVTFKVWYELIPKFNVTYSATGGSISVYPTSNIEEGATVNIYNYGGTNSHFKFNKENLIVKRTDNNETINLTEVSSNYQYQFVMPASNVNVAMTYIEDASYAITIDPELNGKISVGTECYDNPATSPTTGGYYVDNKIYLSHNEHTGYAFEGWYVTYGEEVEVYVYPGQHGGSDYFIMPNGPVTISAYYSEIQLHTITINQTEGGTLYVKDGWLNPITSAYAGDQVQLSATPNSGYEFVKFLVTVGSQTLQGTNNPLWFGMYDSDITVEAVFELAKQHRTVNNGTVTNGAVPFSFYYSGNNYGQTKSQYIIPFTDLENMIDGTITDLNFYSSSPANHTFNGSWNVYLQEVSFTSFGYSYSFEDVSEMQLVYSGDMSIANNILNIHLDTPYVYEDGNLMVCFEQTSEASNPGDYWNDYWYGVSTSSNSSCDYSSYFSYSWFAPKTTFDYLPNANPAPRYNISINNPEGAVITASKTKAKEGATITLTKVLDEGYVFNNWIVMQGETPVTVDENDQFEMPGGDVTITADLTAPNFYNVYLDEATDYPIYANPEEHILAGKTIRLYHDAESGKTVDAWTVTERIAGTSVEVTFNDNYNCYEFTMPEDDVDVTATFRDLKECTINFYVNGVKWEEETQNILEDEWVYVYNIKPETIPAGTTFTGWATSEIETYDTEQPENLKYSFQVKGNTDLYAVFNFTEKIPTGESSWSQITMLSDLEDGDEVVFEGYQYDYNTYTGYYYLLAQRNSATATNFGKTDGISWSELNQGNFPEGAVIFTAVNNAGSWNFMYEDEFVEGTSALAVNAYGNMGPMSQIGGYDNWSIYSYDGTYTSGYTYNAETNNYINFNGSNFYGAEYDNAASIYRRVIGTEDHNYYMTSVLGFGGADEHIAANTEATNVVIAKNAKLTIDNGATLNVEGLCMGASHDAAQLVIAEGGQLVHHNEGTMATFEKEINGYTGERDNYYFIANPTDNANVAGLTQNTYNLYTFDPAEVLEWRTATVLIDGEDGRGIGYLYANNTTTTLEFAGNLLAAGSKDIDLTYATAGTGIEFPGFNLIGNPFACNAYISGYNFYKIDNTDIILSDVNSIAPCEGILVEATGADQQITLTTTAPAAASAMSINVSQNRGQVIDRAIVSFDGTNDLHKFMMDPARTNIRLAKNGEEFAAISTETEGEIPVSFKAEKNGTYTIDVNTESVNAHYLHLIDNMTGADVDLLRTPSYTFNASTRDYAYRFKLVFNVTMDDTNEGNGGMGNSFAYISNGELIISNEGRATLQVIDVMGRIVRNQEIVGEGRISTEGMVAGVYVINLNGMTQKIVVK